MTFQIMKILILFPSPMSFKYFLSDTYLSMDYEVHIACKKYDDLDLYEERFTYHFIDFERNPSIKSAFFARRQLIDLVWSLKPSLIHAHFTSSVFLLAISKRKIFPKCIGTVQGSIYLGTNIGLKRSLFQLVETWSMRSMDRSFVLTDDDYVALKRQCKNVYLQ